MSPFILETLSRLQSQEIVRYTRGRISIVNRAELESRACACYRLLEENRRHAIDVAAAHSSAP